MTRESIMKSGGYYVATHVLTVWKCLVGLAPDQPHVWSFPDAPTKRALEHPKWIRIGGDMAKIVGNTV
jgi:hypothetical protein